MELNRLYDLASKENIPVFSKKLDYINGIYFVYDKDKAIVLDNRLNSIDEKCTLAEELSHYYTDSTYSLYSDSETISKQEYKAKKYQVKLLIPYEDLKLAIKKGYTTNYELADYFDVKIDLIEFAKEYYLQKMTI